MKQLLRFINDKFLSNRLDFRVRLFNVLAMAGMTISMSMVLFGIFTNVGMWNILVNLIATVLAFCLLYYSYKSGKYQQCYMFTTAVIFLIFFPILFFTSGGYHGGMPSFFIFAVFIYGIYAGRQEDGCRCSHRSDDVYSNLFNCV